MTQYITPEAYQKLKKELEELKTVKRQEIAQRIKEAKDLGDLSENASYQEAKEAQSKLETQILELESYLKTVTLIHHPKTNGKLVEVGSTVLVQSVLVQSLTPPRAKKTFIITGSLEANPLEGRISNESPLGQAFLKKKKGDIVVVKTPKGEVKYKILKIT